MGSVGFNRFVKELGKLSKRQSFYFFGDRVLCFEALKLLVDKTGGQVCTEFGLGFEPGMQILVREGESVKMELGEGQKLVVIGSKKGEGEVVVDCVIPNPWTKQFETLVQTLGGLWGVEVSGDAVDRLKGSETLVSDLRKGVLHAGDSKKLLSSDLEQVNAKDQVFELIDALVMGRRVSTVLPVGQVIGLVVPLLVMAQDLLEVENRGDDVKGYCLARKYPIWQFSKAMELVRRMGAKRMYGVFRGLADLDYERRKGLNDRECHVRLLRLFSY